MRNVCDAAAPSSLAAPPGLERIDHIHVFVADRAAAERWYAEVLGLTRVAALASWAAEGGPLTLANASETIHLAVFEKPAQPCRSTIALGVSATEFAAWQQHLRQALQRSVEPVDHGLSWSLYFTDPDGNPFEITTYDRATVAAVANRGASAS